MSFSISKWFGIKLDTDNGLKIKLRFYKWYFLTITMFVEIEEEEKTSLRIK
ncbi:MAG TPA: hypothetical protein PL042_01635 [Caldisericia bacterium]|nr:hypothetical protein [Caldisericia bacterium]